MNTWFWIVFAIFGIFCVLLLLRRRAPRRAHANEAPARQPPPSLPRKLYNVNALPPLRPMPDDDALGIVRGSGGRCMVLPCEHHERPRAVRYRVFGQEFIFPVPSRCPECMQGLLEVLSEHCAVCGLGIPPSCNVAIAWVGAPHPFTHIECAEARTLLCGMWGWGQLMPLSTLDARFNVGATTAIEDALIDEARERENASNPSEAAPDEESEETTDPSVVPKPGAN
ncbi:MAG: hypothetical protein QY323_03560 [Patescibacteria group bacterium]|nr:MAG: hypothetical protein QY323_03560 [Patescibacteria group bacterium]